MHKTLLLFLLLLVANVTIGQSDNFTIDLKIKSLRYKNESVVFDSSQSITIKTNGSTDIVKIGVTKSYEFGVKIEILKSNFYEPNSYIVARAFYIKSGSEWREMSHFNHTQQLIEPISERQSKEIDKYYGSYSVGDPKEFEIELQQFFYYLK